MHFADFAITTTPPLFVQDKQQVTERREMLVSDAAEHKQQFASVQSIQDEHKLCDLDALPHVFIFTTDLLLSPEVPPQRLGTRRRRAKEKLKGKRRKVKRKLRDNEVVIHRGNNQLFYGNLLTFLKAC